MGFPGFYWFLLGFTKFYLVLLGFTRFYWVLLGFNPVKPSSQRNRRRTNKTQPQPHPQPDPEGIPLPFHIEKKFNQSFPKSSGFTVYLLIFTGFYWVLMGLPEFDQVLIGITGF